VNRAPLIVLRMRRGPGGVWPKWSSSCLTLSSRHVSQLRSRPSQCRLITGAVKEVSRNNMPKKLFVGGLSWNTSEESLRQAFESFGEVTEAKVIMDRETGRSRGFGFVTFGDDEHAVAAKTEMNGTELDGRTIRVDEAFDRERRGGDKGSFGRSDSGDRW